MDLVYVSNANLLLFADATERLVNSLDVQPRSFVRYPFDLIGVEAISKAFALRRAASLLISNGYHDEALGLMRTLIELAMNLRYLTAQRESLGQRATTSYDSRRPTRISGSIGCAKHTATALIGHV